MVAAVLGATVARADDFDGHHDCGPRPTWAPQGQVASQGQYQLQTVQTWVEGQAQQVWVPGQCRQHRHFQRCSQGSYRMVQTPGHYETRQEWVWVATADPYQGARYGRRHGAARVGMHLARPAGSFSVSVY